MYYFVLLPNWRFALLFLYKLLNWQKRENVSSDTFMLIVFLRFMKDISFNRYLQEERMLTDRQQEVQYMFYS